MKLLRKYYINKAKLITDANSSNSIFLATSSPSASKAPVLLFKRLLVSLHQLLPCITQYFGSKF
jgi:hypothetical protein